MSREIKFRAWSYGIKSDTAARRRQYGEWVFPPQMLYDEKQGDCLVWKSQGQNIEVMQYTGLRDKNGKEIYEGDIVRMNDCGDLFDHEVKWIAEDAKFVFECTGEWYSGTDLPLGQCEVIGNIHDNPELLEARSAIGTTEYA